MMNVIPDIKFFDTSSLLLFDGKIPDKFLISSITLKELENIKSSVVKDDNIKYAARQVLRILSSKEVNYDVIIHKPEYENFIAETGFSINDDVKILADAYYANNHMDKYIDRVIFVTNDLLQKRYASIFFGDGMIEQIEQEEDNYTGYKEIVADDDLLATLYQDIKQNIFNLNNNEYLILKNNNREIIDLRVWRNGENKPLNYGEFQSDWFGRTRPYDKDPYQKLLFDSLLNNQITLIKGPSGTGKTLISLSFLMSQLEHRKIDKVIIFCNTVATANSARLGFYQGSKDEKLLDSQIGNLLASKFGSKEAVRQLMDKEQLLLLPFSDLRGYDTSGMNAGIYISEAQNLDITLMKLALQRIGKDCVCIIDGDEKSQVDMPAYGGKNNGMKRVSKIFRGETIYGEVALKNIYRSRISEIADKM